MKKYCILFAKGLISAPDKEVTLSHEELQQCIGFSEEERMLLRNQYSIKLDNTQINALKKSLDKLKKIIDIIKKESTENNRYHDVLIKAIENSIQNIDKIIQEQAIKKEITKDTEKFMEDLKNIVQYINHIPEILESPEGIKNFHMSRIEKTCNVIIDKIIEQTKPSIENRLKQYETNKLNAMQNKVKKHIALLREVYRRIHLAKEKPLPLQAALPEKKILLPVLILNIQEVVTIANVISTILKRRQPAAPPQIATTILRTPNTQQPAAPHQTKATSNTQEIATIKNDISACFIERQFQTIMVQRFISKEKQKLIFYLDLKKRFQMAMQILKQYYSAEYPWHINNPKLSEEENKAQSEICIKIRHVVDEKLKEMPSETELQKLKQEIHKIYEGVNNNTLKEHVAMCQHLYNGIVNINAPKIPFLQYLQPIKNILGEMLNQQNRNISKDNADFNQTIDLLETMQNHAGFPMYPDQKIREEEYQINKHVF